ncbi:MAG TPA: protein kinase [Thermoanaerobaculia bacterium]|nr:protein kinase [Thermoanaerobaculia bacterium]
MNLSSGTRVGPYEVLSPIGAGGMGEVYKARDSRLGREVAIKVLPAHLAGDPEALARFEREARAVAALSHPNIVAIYDCGRDGDVAFAVMELLEGESLRSRLSRSALPWRKVVEIGIAVGEGLSAAHARGVIHRDLKPENVFVTSEGLVKILDFGLARGCRTDWISGESRDPTRPFLTEPGTVLGTVGYMSPEQVRGEEVSVPGDIFSVGCVLYEMLTGHGPFRRGSGGETIAAVLNEEPPALADSGKKIPPELDRIVAHCLEKSSSGRFHSARDLVFALQALQSGSRATESLRGTSFRGRGKSLAVLPFANVGAEPSADYLADGITETVISNLAQLPRLRVMARSTVFRYKGRAVDPRRVGRELNVSAILTGTVVPRAGTLHIGVELVDVANGWQLWGHQYDCKPADIFSVQEEIANEISEKLRIKLTQQERKRLVKRHTQNTEAYHLYLKGRYHWNRRTEEGFQKAIEYFEQAILKDAEYALAYAGLADSYTLLGSAGYGSSLGTAMAKAKAAAEKALQLDESLAEAHASLGFVKFRFDWDFRAAEREFQRAVELNPGYSVAHHWYALYLTAMDRQDEALGEIRRAQELEPLTNIVNTAVGRVFHFARRYDEAIQALRQVLDMDPNFVQVHFDLGLCYAAKSMFPDAISELHRAAALSGGRTLTKAALGYVYAVAGQTAEARKVLEELHELPERNDGGAFYLAMVCAGLQDTEQAFKWLDKACQERSGLLVYLKVEPIFDPLRSDSRFLDLMQRVGLST